MLSAEMYNKILMFSFPISEEIISKLIKCLHITLMDYFIVTFTLKQFCFTKYNAENGSLGDGKVDQSLRIYERGGMDTTPQLTGPGV